MNFHTGFDNFVGIITAAQQKTLSRKTNTLHWIDRYLNRNREELFPAPRPEPAVRTGHTRSIAGFDYQTLFFESDHLPLVEETLGDYRRHHGPLHTFKARKVSRRGFSPRRAIVHVHGWMEPGSILEDVLVGPLMCRGLDADLYHFQLPHHGERQIRESRYDGAMFVTADLMLTFEAIRQSVMDTRTVIQHVLNLGIYDEVGVTGISLGAMVTKLTACTESRISWAVPIIGHLDLTDVIDKAPILDEVRKEMASFGISTQKLGELIELVGFTRVMPVIPHERIIVVAARDDVFVRADSMRRQLDRWPGVQEVWIPGGHLTSLIRLPGLLPDLRRRLDRLPARAAGKL
ncbi:MAG: alpha/beta hydrolase family protein [Deltaproteobacteria bacterium]|nr:alpha/beta hydrolase family protein [Deltaproteobacteria bacterium]